MNYAETSELALQLLTEFGQGVTRLEQGSSVYSPTTGAATSATSTSVRQGALFDFGAGSTLVRGSLIQAGDKRLLLDATDSVLPTDQFAVGGKTYSVISVGEVNPAGTCVLYDLHVRA